MNIIVKPYGSISCYCRPDTTWERENRDYYVPDCINELHWAPVIFVRISKAGKCIGEKFASRYYDAFNFGAMLYCHGGSEDNVAFSSCADHSSILPTPLYNLAVMDNGENSCEIRKKGEIIFHTEMKEIEGKALIEEAICRASKLTSLRIGDFVAVELAPLSFLAAREEGGTEMTASFCENDLFDLKLVF